MHILYIKGIFEIRNLLIPAFNKYLNMLLVRSLQSVPLKK